MNVDLNERMDELLDRLASAQVHLRYYARAGYEADVIYWDQQVQKIDGQIYETRKEMGLS